MGFVDSVKTCYGKYATFSGRAPRSEYWWFVLASWLFGILVFAIFTLAGYLVMGDSGGLGIIGGGIAGPIGLILFYIFNFLPMLSVAVRRLHDTGRSGFWYFIVLVPFGIGAIWFLVLMLLDSDDENQYGLPVY